MFIFMSFIKVGPFAAIISSNNLSSPISLFSFWVSHNVYAGLLNGEPLVPLFTFLQPFLFLFLTLDSIHCLSLSFLVLFLFVFFCCFKFAIKSLYWIFFFHFIYYTFQLQNFFLVFSFSFLLFEHL